MIIDRTVLDLDGNANVDPDRSECESSETVGEELGYENGILSLATYYVRRFLLLLHREISVLYKADDANQFFTSPS